MNQITIILLTGAGVAAGFMVGLGIGKEVRANAESNIKADYQDGKVLIEADVENALKQGVMDYLNG